MRSLLTATLIAGIWAAPAAAQDASAPPEATFTGPRAELLVGYDRIGGDDASDGIAYGGAAGFDFDLGGVVAGVEGEFTTSGIDEDGVLSDGTSEFETAFDLGRDLYVGGRLGFRAAPRTLIYAKAGYTNTKFDIEAQVAAGAGVGFEGTVDGYRLGAGIEQVLSASAIGNAFLKLEYRYSNYGGLEIDEEQFDLDEFDTEIDLDRHQVMAGIGIRF